MTNKNSICAKCKNLDTDCNSFATDDNGNIVLIAHCIYGGKNAGNRKMCKRFKQADNAVVDNRVNAFNRAEDLMNSYNIVQTEADNDES